MARKFLLKADMQVPVIAMTANAIPGDRDKCLEAGMNAYISKPIEMIDMVTTMAQWITPDCYSNEDSR